MYNMLIYPFFMFMVSVCMVALSLSMKFAGFVVILDWCVYSLKSMNMTFYLMVDWVSLQFMGGVLLISFMVMLYKTVYMSNDVNLSRCYIY